MQIYSCAVVSKRQTMESRLFLLMCIPLVLGFKGCYIPIDGPQPSHIESPLPHSYLSTVPQEFDWRTRAYLTPPTNQFLPEPCGACWAHASSGALTDRFIITSQASIPLLSPQVLLDCGDQDGFKIGSCYGGSDLSAYKFIYTNGITDVTCMPYLGMAQTNWGERGTCLQRMCRQCDRFGDCRFVNGTVYRISEYGTATGEQEMMAEIYARGPIACSLFAHSDYFLNYKNGIISDPTQYNITTHVVAIVGWGVDTTTSIPYWIGRNSFGTVWGEQGWFKLQRGSNTLNMEKRPCSWAVPKT